MSRGKSFKLAGSGLLALALMSGCGKENGGENLKPAAVVNGRIIAVEQVEAELEKLGQVPAEQSQVLANRILRNAIDQELLAQQAVEAKLDGQAEVQMKIAAARRRILADAQIAAMTKNIAEPAEAEIRAYFDGHPELFAKRRVFKLQELLATVPQESLDQVRAMAQQAKSPRELAAALSAKGIQVGGRELVKPAEDLPADLLKQLSGLKAGQSLTVLNGTKLDIVTMVGSEERPVSFDQASPMIARYLANNRKRDQAETELGKLRAQAKIEYKPPYTAIAEKDAGQGKP